MLGRRLAATTGTPWMTILPQGTWAPCTATIGTTATPGSGRSWAAWSASNDTVRRVGASGWRPCHSRPDKSSWRRPRYCLESMTNTPPGPIAKWSRLARLPGAARSCSTAHPWRSSESSSRAVRRSPAAPRRQALASGLGRNRSLQPTAAAASAAATRPSHRASWLTRNPPPTPTPTMTAIRQGRVWVQVAHSAARISRHLAWAEPPGRPTLARTRTVTTGRSASVPARSWSGLSPRWARMAWRSGWLSGRTDPLGRSSSSKGQDRVLAIGCSFLVMLAGGPLRAWPATLGARTRLVGAFAGRPPVVAAVGGTLLSLDPRDRGAGSLPVGPLAWVACLGSEGPVGVGDLVGAPIRFDLGGGVAPGPPPPGRRGHGAEGLQDIARPVSLNS